MKTKLFSLILTMLLIVPSISKAQSNVKSYFCKEMGTAGQVPTVPDRLAAIVTFFEDNTIMVSAGPVTYWRYISTSYDGVKHYSYLRTEGPTMPNTNYVELMITSDYSMMRINYVFGMMGMYTPMYQDYQYLGEGFEPATSWMRGY